MRKIFLLVFVLSSLITSAQVFGPKKLNILGDTIFVKSRNTLLNKAYWDSIGNFHLLHVLRDGTSDSALDMDTCGRVVKRKINSGTGTVSNVASGYGLNGGPITTTGTLLVDTFRISTRAWRQKSTDSLKAIFNAGGGVLPSLSASGKFLYDGPSGAAWSDKLYDDGFSGLTLGSQSTSYYNLNYLSGQHELWSNGSLADTSAISISSAQITLRNSKKVNPILSLVSGNGANANWFNIYLNRGPSGGIYNQVPTWWLNRADTVCGFLDADSIAKKVVHDSLAAHTSSGVTSITAGTGLTGGTIITTGTIAVDTFSISTRAWRQKAVDTLNALIATKGTVSSVAAGYGLSGGTVTTTGTHSVDTFSIATRAWRQKGVDSSIAVTQPLDATLTGLAGLTTAANKVITVTGTDAFSTADHQEISETSYTDSIAWTGSVAPTSLTGAYRWSQWGKQVTFTVLLTYSNPGSSVTQVTIKLPTSCPTPVDWSINTTAGGLQYPGYGFIQASPTSVPTGNARVILRKRTGFNLYEVVCAIGSGNHSYVWATVTYFTN